MSIATQPARTTGPTTPTMSDLAPCPEPVATPTPPAGVRVVDRLYRLNLAQYHAMADAGILNSDERVELLEGLLVRKMTKKRPHVIGTDLVQATLIRAIPAGWYVSMQNPVEIAEAESEPEPDIQVVRGSTRDYQATIQPGNLGLVVEVSDSSVRDDQTSKKRLYAIALIPFYWILNLVDRRLEVYSDPTGPDSSPDYRRRTDHGPEDVVPLILDGQEAARINIRDLLP